MSQYEALNTEKHRQLRVKTGYSAALGDAVMYVMTYPMEFRDIQSCYPILFTKDPNTGGFFASAVLGLEPNQNLFLQDNSWDAAYVPALAERQGTMLIAWQEIAGAEVSAASVDITSLKMSSRKARPRASRGSSSPSTTRHRRSRRPRTRPSWRANWASRCTPAVTTRRPAAGGSALCR